jgi:hypothetical protein
VVNVSTPGECCALCATPFWAYQNCQFWTYDPVALTCWFKDNNLGKKTAKGLTSGSLIWVPPNGAPPAPPPVCPGDTNTSQSYLPGHVCGGTGLLRAAANELEVPTQEGCSAACCRRENCSAWQWIPDQENPPPLGSDDPPLPSSEPHGCWLGEATTCVPRLPTLGVIAGLRSTATCRASFTTSLDEMQCEGTN